MLKPEDRPLFGALILLAVAMLVLAVVKPFDAPLNGCGQQTGNAEAFKECVEIVSAQSVAEYTRLLAWFTAILAAFTVVLAGASLWQGYLTRKSIALASDEFNATHRPEIVIHSVQYIMIGHIGTEVSMIGALVTFFNKGTTDAFVQTRTGAIGRFATPLSFNINPGPIAGVLNERIRSGAQGHFNVHSTILVDDATTQTFDDERVFCLGVISYADASGNVRHTGFGRTLDTTNPEDGGERWVRVTDENPYEYAY